MSVNRESFERFARLELEPQVFRQRIRVAWQFDPVDGSFGVHQIPEISPPIAVGAVDVVRALDYLQKEQWSRDDLQVWANLLLLVDGFEIDLQLPQGRRELLLEVLHRLASPQVFSELYGRELDDIRSELAGSA